MVPISCSILSAASLAPPWAGPHRHAMPAAIQAKGFAPEEPARRTVDVDAFCSWSACRMKIVSSALANTGLPLYSSQGTAKHMRRKFAVEQQIADFQKRGMRRQLVDRVAAIQQYPFVAVDEGDVAFARGGGGESRIVGENVGVGVKLANIDDVGTFGRFIDRKIDVS